MTSLNIDFRDNCLRILAVKDGSSSYSTLIKDFTIDDEKSATDRLASAIKEAGGKKGKVNIILPFHILNYKIYKTPPLEIEDTWKLIQRQLSRELEGQDFSFSIKSFLKRTGAAQQEILAEYALEADVVRYLNVLRACRVRPDMIVSSLHGNALLFNTLYPVTDGNEAVIDIGMDFIEVAVFNNKQMLMYDRLPILHAHDEKPYEQEPLEHQDKIKIYKMVETLYQFLMKYSKNFPEEKLSKLWLCGTGSLTEGITDSLSDGLGVKAGLLHPFASEIEYGSALTALAGTAQVSRDEQFINLLPRDIFEKRSRLLKRVIIAVSLLFYFILLAGGALVLNILEKNLKQEHEKIMADQALLALDREADALYASQKGTYIKLVSGSVSLYSIFRDIANLIPKGVVLNSIDIEKTDEGTTLKINARIRYTDENFRRAVLSTFLTSLDRSSRLRQIPPPEISVKKDGDEKEITVTAKYEVMQ